ncbi:1-acyl-sn-glycerol-3-phosphate acyltransferase [Streptomyces sp. Ru73]|uniref:lysophospholipid acyltransferase family protein n=1 Tax=Streptomyces sp. Ru73 TaxID=2080748 RepID=UPI000CDDAD83|nr:lysophospholipid acyltransferase family protein [Streptomyces sp. Ru73]POX40561.1 1-acyl-sn-glycerol-3-phosphate acyltransferase [Streptomyces sp. Ru73]
MSTHLATPGSARTGIWDVLSTCTSGCIEHAAPRVPLAGTARRAASFTHVLLRAAADRDRLAEPGRLRRHARAALGALGVGLVHDGPPLRVAGGGTGGRGTLVVVNHISWLDILALLAVEPVTMLAKQEVGGWPVMGPLARRAGTRFIDRSSPRGLPQAVADLAAELRAGRSVVVYPQATTWCSATEGGFRRATFQAAIDAGAPVRPVTVRYLQHGAPSTVPAFVGEEDLASSLRRVLAARALTARVTVHPPLLPHGRDRRELAAVAQEVILGHRRRGLRQETGTYL